MTKAKESFNFVEDEEERDYLTIFSFICMLSFDVYMRKHLIEQIIDYSLKPEVEHKNKENAGNTDRVKKDKN